GNWVHRFNVMPKHRRLRVEAESVVMTQQPGVPAGSSETLAAVERQRPALLDEHYDFLVPSPYVPVPDRLAPPPPAPEEASGGTAGGFARAAAVLVHDNFRYATGSTHVRSSVRDVLAAGAGVCQDFAHLLIALARARGLPARYVSGYLIPEAAGEGSNGIEQVVGGRASHAWADVFLPGPGWFGLDPPLGTPTSGRHVRVACGRDYGDVVPVRGVYRGQAGQRLSVNVLVRPAVDDDGCEHLSESVEPAPTESSSERLHQQQ